MCGLPNLQQISKDLILDVSNIMSIRQFSNEDSTTITMRNGSQYVVAESMADVLKRVDYNK